MTLTEWRIQIGKVLSKAGFENPDQEAKWLLAGVLERESSFILVNPSYAPSASEEQKVQEWVNRRLRGEPLSRLKGFREFWSLPFQLNEHTLDPRPETELLVEAVLQWVDPQRDHPWRILDLGTGSGCLLIALLHELEKATGMGVDTQEETLIMARTNAALNGVGNRSAFTQSNWGANIKGRPFDIIVSNPPYLPLKDKETLDKSILAYDPPQALFGGEDGLVCYRILAQEIKDLLTPQGIAVLEIGWDQGKAVTSLFQEAGYKILFVLKDLAGLNRAVGLALA